MKVHLTLASLLLAASPALGQGALGLWEARDEITAACRQAITEVSRKELADVPFVYSMGVPNLQDAAGFGVGDRMVFPDAVVLQGTGRHRAFVECGLDTQGRRVTWVQVFFRMGEGDFGPAVPTPDTIGGIPIDQLPLAGPVSAGSFGATIEPSPGTSF